MIQLSVIIPTRNRCLLLNRTLKSILAQTYQQEHFEIIIVDNGSTDATSKIAGEYYGRFQNIVYVHEEKPGLHEGRHAGLRVSQGKILIYADDDIEAFPSWLEGVHESFLDERVGLVGGKDLPLYESSPPGWLEDLWEKVEHGRYLTYYSLLDLGDALMEIEPDFVFGCNFSIRKDLLLQIQGFHPDGIPESLMKFRGDGETFVARQVRKLGYKIIYNPKASVKHWVPESRLNLEYIKKRAFMSGVSQSYTDTREEIMFGKNKNWIKTNLNKIRTLKLFFRKSLKSKILKSYYAGYQFHQDQLKKDKDLIKWVLQKNYL